MAKAYLSLGSNERPEHYLQVAVNALRETFGNIIVSDWVQTKAVLTTVIWSGVVSFVAYKIVDMTIGLRVSEESEREGLDITSHGETAYGR